MANRIVAVFAAALLSVAACGESAQDEEAQLEQVGEDVEEAAGEVGAAAEQAGEGLQDAAADAAEEVDEAVGADDDTTRDTVPR